MAIPATRPGGRPPATSSDDVSRQASDPAPDPAVDLAADPQPYRRARAGLRRSFILAGLFSAGVNLLMLTGPLYMLQIYDRVLASGSVPTLMGLFVIVVVAYGFLGLYEAVRARILSRAGYRLDRLLAGPAFAFQLRGTGAGNGTGNGTAAGAAGVGPSRDLDTLRGFLAGPAVRGLFDLPWIPIFLLTVFLIHPWLGWLTLAGAGVVAGLAWLNHLSGRGELRAATAGEAEAARFAERSRRSAETLRALGMAGAVTARWRALHDAGLARGQRGGERSDLFAAVSRAFRLLLQSMLLTMGAWLALHQQISAGMIVGASILAGRALAPVDQVIAQWGGIGRALEAHRRLKTTFGEAPPDRARAGEAPLDQAAPARVSLPAPNGALKLAGVTKLVPGPAGGEPRRILDRVSFELAPGDGLGVIGNSAAGKSSLARLLVGGWTPEAGELRLDGATLDQWAPDELGRHIGYLPQQVEMLPGTVAENIARFDPDAEERDIFAAARMAGVHEMILGLAEGYATRIGEGPTLSGGQVQRLGLARAIYGRPKLVVLDEPNAHLDAAGEEVLGRTIAHLRKRGCTLVVMAHRPSVIAGLNKVLILHQGRVARFGDKDEIMRMTMSPLSGSGAAAERAAAEEAEAGPGDAGQGGETPGHGATGTGAGNAGNGAAGSRATGNGAAGNATGSAGDKDERAAGPAARRRPQEAGR